MNPKHIACIVLASGLSNRFGPTEKLEAILCGKPVLVHVLETAASLDFGQVFVVSRRAIPTEHQVIINDEPERGQGHSLRLGVRAAREAGWETICVLLGDMPLVTRHHIGNLIQVCQPRKSVVSDLAGCRMPPAVFEKTALSKILESESGLGARAVFDAFALEHIPIPREQALDVDTSEDFDRVSAIMKTRLR